MIRKGFVEQGRTYLAKNLWISENNHSIFCAGQCDIETSRVVQESNSLMFVASHAAENNVVFFTSLERVYTGHFNLLVHFFFHRTVELHIVDDIGSLALVRRND